MSQVSPQWNVFFSQFIGHGPPLVVALAGLILALVSSHRLRGATIPLAAGCGLYFLGHIVHPAIQLVLFPLMLRNGNAEMRINLINLTSFFFTFYYTGCFALMIWAAFADRSPPQNAPDPLSLKSAKPPVV